MRHASGVTPGTPRVPCARTPVLSQALKAGLALSVGLLLAACAPEAPEEQRPGETQLTFCSALSQAEWDVLRQQVFPGFERANRCTVRGLDVASVDMAGRLSGQRPAGAMDVDVIGQATTALWPLVQQGLVEDLSAYAQTLPAETIPALIDAGRVGGKLYFLPYRPTVEIAYYNVRGLGKHYLNPPRDWDELLAVARWLHKKEGVGRVAIKADGTAGATNHYVDFIRAAGGDPLVLNDRGSKQAFAYLATLWPYLSTASQQADADTMNQFLALETVFLGRNWPTGIEAIVDRGKQPDVFAYHGWRGPVREAHSLGGDVLGIPKGAPQRELALKFVAYMQSREVQAQLVEALAWPPMRTDAYSDVAGWRKPYFEAVREALAQAVARPIVPFWADVDQAINLAAREILLEGQAVDSTLDRHAAKLHVARARKGEGRR